jgi:DNA polymerase-3 subunit gamma/tau
MSEQYLVSARKYRPQTFDTVVGQEHITTTLKNAIRHEHLAHAYLFCGPRGVGKTTCARILAKTINCETPTADIEACGQCPTCQSFQNNTSFNVFELDAASNNSVEDIRNLIDQVRFAPQQGRYKIYIIDEVHMLSAAAFNAFLKTLEEPPAYAIFILATTEKHKILPTILSRCQIFDFKRITTQDTVAHLQSITRKENLLADEAALHVIAQKSEGCMRDSLSMLDRISSFTNGHLTYAGTMEHLNLLDADFYFRLTDSLLASDVSGTLLHLDAVLDKGFEGDIVLNGLAEHMRNLLLCKDHRMAKLLDVPNDHRKTYFDKAAQAPPSFILSSLNVINDSELGYKNATNKRLHAELCLIRLCYVLQATAPDDVLKKKADDISDPAEEQAPVSVYQAPPVTNSFPPVAAPPVVTPPVAQVVTPPPPQPGAAPVRSAPNPVPAAVNQAGAKPAAPNRKIAANWLDDIDDEIAIDTSKDHLVQQLDNEAVTTIYDAFRKKLHEDGRHVLHAQMAMIKSEFIAPDEVRLTSPSKIVDSYAQNLRNDILDFFRQRTSVMVRITTDVKENKSVTDNQPKALSKQDIYDLMASKNPYLNKLKEDLNLQMEY